MSISEKVSYIKGLADGMELDKETKEGKIMGLILEVLQDMAASISDIEDSEAAIGDELDAIGEELDAISEDLGDVENAVFGNYDGDSDGDYRFDDDDYMFSVKCPKCGNEITIDENVLASGSIECPDCGEKLEFDLDDEDEEQ